MIHELDLSHHERTALVMKYMGESTSSMFERIVIWARVRGELKKYSGLLTSEGVFVGDGRIDFKPSDIEDVVWS